MVGSDNGQARRVNRETMEEREKLRQSERGLNGIYSREPKDSRLTHRLAAC